MTKLTNQDFCEAADILGCSVAAIKAVATVESGGRGGFDSKNRVLIRFEGHKFREFTGKRFDRTHPTVSYRYHRSHRGCGKHHGYTGFNIAFKLDPIAAMKACSIGMFQPMVFNYHELGYSSVHDMWDDFKKGEGNQLLAFVRLIQNWGLDDELRRAKLADFTTFARMYNGRDFASNNYHRKMYKYYHRYRRQNLDCSQFDLSEKESEKLVENIKESATVPVVNPTDESQTDIPETGLDSTDIAKENSENSSTSSNTEQSQTTETKVVVEDGDVKVETSENKTLPKKIAIEKTKPRGFISTIRKEISALVGGNIAFQAVIDGLSRIKEIGMSQTFWFIVGGIAIVGSVIYLIYRYLDFRSDQKRDLEITNKLIDANSTPENKVYLVAPEHIDILKEEEFEVVRR